MKRLIARDDEWAGLIVRHGHNADAHKADQRDKLRQQLVACHEAGEDAHDQLHEQYGEIIAARRACKAATFLRVAREDTAGGE